MRTIKQLIVRKVKSPKPFKLKIQNYKNPKTKPMTLSGNIDFLHFGSKSRLVCVRMDRGCAGNITIKLRGVRMQITFKLNGAVPNA